MQISVPLHLSFHIRKSLLSVSSDEHLQDERWLLLVDEGETEAIYAEGALQAAKASTNRGLYSSKPSAMLLAAVRCFCSDGVPKCRCV